MSTQALLQSLKESILSQASVKARFVVDPSPVANSLLAYFA